MTTPQATTPYTLWQVEEAYFAAVRAYMAAMNWPPPVYTTSHDTGPDER